MSKSPKEHLIRFPDVDLVFSGKAGRAGGAVGPCDRVSCPLLGSGRFKLPEDWHIYAVDMRGHGALRIRTLYGSVWR